MIRHLAIAAAGLAAALTLLPPLAAAQAQPPAPPIRLLKAENVDCSVGRPHGRPSDSVSWSGACEQGLASGNGVAQWFNAGKPTLRFEGTFRAGLIQGRGRMTAPSGDAYEGEYQDGMRHGMGVVTSATGGRFEGSFVMDRMGQAARPAAPAPATPPAAPVAAAPATAPAAAGSAPVVAHGPAPAAPASAALNPAHRMRNKLLECNMGYRYVRGDVEPELDLADEALVKGLLARSAQFAQHECPSSRRFANIMVHLYQNDVQLVGARNYEETGFNWSEYVNKPVQARQRLANEARERAIQAENQRMRQAEQARRNAEALAAERMRDEAARREVAFRRENGNASGVPRDQLMANPFQFEGRNIAVLVRFERMLARDQALGSVDGKPLVISGVPPSTFSAPGMAIVAGRVLGVTPVNLPVLGSTPATHLRHIGTHVCGDERCSEMLPR